MRVEVDSIVFGDHRPDSNIELAPVEQKRVFNVLLHDPGFRLRILVEDKLVDVTQVSEDFNTAPLVKRCWLDKPHVLLAVL